MLNKDPIRITSIVITFVIFLTGAALSFWIYLQIIQKPIVVDDKAATKIEVDATKLKKVQTLGTPSVTTPESGYGRANPFVPYKPQP